MKYLVLIVLALPDIAFAQYYAGTDFTAGKTQLKIDMPPNIVVQHQTSYGAWLRLFNGYQWDNRISLESGVTLRTPFEQTAIYTPLPDSGYRIVAHTYHIDLALGYQLPDSISSHVKIFLGGVWTRYRFHVDRYILGMHERYAVSDIHIKPLYSLQYAYPISPDLTWRTNLTKYGNDTILSFGISHAFN